MAERKNVMATVVVGPEKLLGSGYRWAQVDIVKPRSAISEKVKSFDIQPTPDNRWVLTYEYVSGRSLGVTNKGTVSSRVYKKHRAEVVDEVVVTAEDGTVIGRYDENGEAREMKQEREWTETEMARLEALDDWLDGVRARRECLGAASGLFGERERLKRMYAEDVSIYAPELGARFKAVRREIYEIAMELWRRGEAMNPRPLLEKAVSDDMTKEDER